MSDSTHNLRFDSEYKKDVRLPWHPSWLPRAMRLRFFLPGVFFWFVIFLFFDVGLTWSLVLISWLILHWYAHRAIRWKQYIREKEILRQICEKDAIPITSFYRHERPEAEMANPSIEVPQDLDQRLVSEFEPSHVIRGRLAREWLNEFSRPGLISGDVGCLAGDVSIEHTNKGHIAFLFDLDLKVLRVASKKTGRPVVQADACHFPIQKEAFEFITFFEVIEHIFDPAKAMREISSSLKPGGHLLMSTDNAGFLLGAHLFNPLIVLERVFGIFFPSILPPRNLVKEDEKTGKTYPHVSFSSSQIKALAEVADLKIMWLKSYGFFPGFQYPLSKLFPMLTQKKYANLVFPIEMLFQSLPVLSRLGTHWVLACEKKKSIAP
ncbi:MAG: class I SAM-dependent methyltransferase [bacterium]|nr:class I SAM-dependent methyltransferase [bacterium]